MSSTSADSSFVEGHGFDYDLVVIGGGSGGLACSKEAAKLGKKVACLDFVKPSPQGTSWGLGGTCVNVGCIPKKLFHYSSLLGEGITDAQQLGWRLKSDGHDWSKMVESVQDYIGSLNWGYKVSLKDNKVTYINALASFKDEHTLECKDRRGKVSYITSCRFVIAVGGRPKYLGIEGDKECCITSDDIFSHPSPPGKTLCVGASYISMETAGFLHGLGYDVSIMARSIFLRGFDQDIAEQIASYMEKHGVKIFRPCIPTKFEKIENGKVKVTFKNLDFDLEMIDIFDTVILAVGRYAETDYLNLDKAGVIINSYTGKIPAVNEQTNVAHIYAIGDVLDQRQELTPVAIQAGVLLARRLYGNSHLTMDYNLVPTTVFTPLEYGCIGMAEEDAMQTYGEDNVEVYHSFFKPLEWQMNHEQKNGIDLREDNVCYAKLVTNKLDNDRVVGFHVLSPNAGEITQGYALAMRLGAKKKDFDATIGIHPTISEEFTILKITKRSGNDPKKKGC